MFKFRLTVLLAALLVLSACRLAYSGPGATPSPAPSLPPVSSDLVLRITQEGGFVAPSWHFSQTPILAVYADGRVITTGPQIMIYPGPMMPNLQVAQLTARGLARLLGAAAEAGLADKNAAYPSHNVADAPDTVFLLIHDGQQTATSFGALGIEPMLDAPAAEVSTRATALAFLEQSSALANLVGAAELGPSESYIPEAIQILAWPGDPSENDSSLTREPVAWPLVTALASFGAPLLADQGLSAGARCGVAHAAEVATLLPVLNAATTLTGFSSVGQVYTVLPRPLLPDESGCVVPEG